MPKLTKSIVDAATPREKQFTIWCSELKGFSIFVQPSGSRTYFVDYRNQDGVRKRMTIGRHGKITAEEARKLAIDPSRPLSTRNSSDDRSVQIDRQIWPWSAQEFSVHAPTINESFPLAIYVLGQFFEPVSAKSAKLKRESK